MLNRWYGIPVRLSILVYSVIAGTQIEKCQSSLKGKNFHLINMVDTCEIDYALVPNTKGKSGLWKHLIYVSGRQMTKMMLNLLYLNSEIPLSNLREAP